MIKAIIIDDEEHCCESLTLLLGKYCKNVDVVVCTQSLTEAKQLIEKHQPDVVFLDVEMPKGTGFDLLGTFNEINFEVIFTTAYNHYALKAIKFSALDYLLKPINAEELITAVAKIKPERLNNKNAENLINNLKGNANRIILNTSTGLEFVEVPEIIWCKAESNYTYIYLTNNRKVLATKTLKEFEELLTEAGFFRVHHSNLINLKHMVKYVRGEGGHVIMSDGTNVYVSARKKSDFLRALDSAHS